MLAAILFIAYNKLDALEVCRLAEEAEHQQQMRKPSRILRLVLTCQNGLPGKMDGGGSEGRRRRFDHHSSVTHKNEKISLRTLRKVTVTIRPII